MKICSTVHILDNRLGSIERALDMLKAANYKGHISLEGKYGDDFETGMTATLPYVAPFKSVN